MQRRVDEIDVKYVKGVGETRARALAEFNIHTVEDLLFFFPRRYLDRSNLQPINRININDDVTVVGKVVNIEKITRPKKRLEVTIYDGTGLLKGTWFNFSEYFVRTFKKDQEYAFSGKVSYFKGWQIVHPDYDLIDEAHNPLHTTGIIPLYPGSQKLQRVGINSYSLRKIIHAALEKYGEGVQENLPGELLHRYHLAERAEAFRQVHFPETTAQPAQALRRFKYEEVFYFQILMAIRHAQHHAPAEGIKMTTNFDLIRKVLNKLPFELTDSQKKVLREIYDDMRSGYAMNRLLQGDVGSGKTLVALISALIAIENGFQAALMVPTEILAEQHFLNIQEIVAELGISTGLLVGSISPKEKEAVQQKIAEGEINLVVGTHALVQEKVQFKRLGLVIIDEQHRFGVMQRGTLMEKGLNPHVLVMTATPIPRTLAMTFYGDLDTSIISELPKGRQPIATYWRKESELPTVFEFVREHLDRGEQAYIIYPLVEESEKMDLKAATESFNQLKKGELAKYNLDLLHGRLSAAEKEAVMRQFKNGEVQVLVSTTVVEVGVDVPNATILVVEHAERFGLSQLHQLRGRVGRGTRKSYCLLITPENINPAARQRMRLMEKTTDGFLIAEEDLKLRGSGEFFGTRQHGMPDLKFTDLAADQKLIQVARKDAFELVEKDPHLRSPAIKAIRDYFFQHYAEKYKIARIS
ncbi:MAG: ATP-dependent DNA helicase RecG [Calditrichia bacterium]